MGQGLLGGAVCVRSVTHVVGTGRWTRTGGRAEAGTEGPARLVRAVRLESGEWEPSREEARGCSSSSGQAGKLRASR